MKDNTPERAVALQIENGQYFAEAIVWYNKVFIFPLRDACIMQIFAYLLLVAVTIMLFNVYRVFPLVAQVKVVVTVNDTINFIPKIVTASPSGSTKEFIVSNLAEKYLKSREGYNPRRFKSDYLFVLRSSSKQIFDNYYSYINYYSSLLASHL